MSLTHKPFYTLKFDDIYKNQGEPMEAKKSRKGIKRGGYKRIDDEARAEIKRVYLAEGDNKNTRKYLSVKFGTSTSTIGYWMGKARAEAFASRTNTVEKDSLSDLGNKITEHINEIQAEIDLLNNKVNVLKELQGRF